MSKDVSIINSKGALVCLPENHNFRGGAFPLGGTNGATLNVTEKYDSILEELFGPTGLNVLDGMNLEEGLSLLSSAKIKLGTAVPERDYWKVCEGNVKLALTHLECLAILALTYFPNESMTWEVQN